MFLFLAIIIPLAAVSLVWMLWLDHRTQAMTKEFRLLLDDLAKVPLAQHREHIDFAIQDARDLLAHNEGGIALENICSNLYEWEFPLCRADYIRLQRIGRHYGFKNDTWSFLETTVV